MHSESSVRAQIDRLSGGQRLLGRKEIAELPKILWDDERIHDACQGMYNNGQGLLVATQKRLIFVDKGLLWGLKVEDFPVDKISSIQYETGLVFGTITIFTSGNKAFIKNVEKTAARAFAEGVRARLAAKSAAPPAPVAVSTITSSQSPSSVADELKKLADLQAQGVLSADEFSAAKKRLLGV